MKAAVVCVCSLLLASLPLSAQTPPGDTAPAAPTAPAPAPDPNAPPPAYIILKIDDVTRATARWKKVFDFARERKIKVAAGIICNSLEGPSKEAYCAWLKELQQSGYVEFWNHGYDHKQWKDADGKDVWEFKGSGYDLQKEHFSKSQQLAKEKLGFALPAFGAPFNAVDENTVKVLSEDPDTKVFLYGTPEQAALLPNIMILERTWMNIEDPLFLPNSQKIQKTYAALVGKKECFVLQGHPDQWTDERFEEFVKLVEFLVSKGVCFTTPVEYYNMKQAQAGKPPLSFPWITAPAAAP